MATPISWEIFFPDRTREGVEDGARLVLNPTNGASFTGTIVQTQQVASSRMRAIESGRWVGAGRAHRVHGGDRRRRRRARAHAHQRAGGASSARSSSAKGLTIYTRSGNLPSAPALLVVPAGVESRAAGVGPAFAAAEVDRACVTCTASRKARSWVTRSSVPSKALEGRLELLDGLEVEVVGGLVEHQAVDALGHQLGEQRPGALAR